MHNTFVLQTAQIVINFLFIQPTIEDCAICSNYTPTKDNNEEQDFDERNEDEEGKSSSTPLIFLDFKISSTRNSCYLAKL
jgi:hypothetical protein